MKYASIVIVVLIVLGVGGFYFYSQNQSSDSMMKKDEAVMEKSDETTEKTDAMMEKSSEPGVVMDGAVLEDKGSGDSMMSDGGYQPFSQSAFDGAKDSKRVLFFFANWCPTCKPIDAQLSASIAEIPAGVEIFRVNYNDSDTDAADKALAAKYGITYQHTFVQVDASGEEVAKWNGGGLDKIVSMVK